MDGQTMKNEGESCAGLAPCGEERPGDGLGKGEAGGASAHEMEPMLDNWPIKMEEIPDRASYFDGADLLVAADCAAYAYADFHAGFMAGKITMIGCPKHGPVGLEEKLETIIRENEVASLTVARMDEPCCGRLEVAARKALHGSGKEIPWQAVAISVDGRILD